MTPGGERECAGKVLETALQVVTQDRETTHGSIGDNFVMIARFWSAYLGVYVSPEDVAWMMTLLKVARAKIGGGHVDNSVDAAGYAAIAEALRHVTYHSWGMAA